MIVVACCLSEGSGPAADRPWRRSGSAAAHSGYERKKGKKREEKKSSQVASKTVEMTQSLQSDSYPN